MKKFLFTLSVFALSSGVLSVGSSFNNDQFTNGGNPLLPSNLSSSDDGARTNSNPTHSSLLNGQNRSLLNLGEDDMDNPNGDGNANLGSFANGGNPLLSNGGGGANNNPALIDLSDPVVLLLNYRNGNHGGEVFTDHSSPLLSSSPSSSDDKADDEADPDPKTRRTFIPKNHTDTGQ